MTTQFADWSGGTAYRAQNSAVSASAGSIGAARTRSPCGHPASAAATGAATSSSTAGVHASGDGTDLVVHVGVRHGRIEFLEFSGKIVDEKGLLAVGVGSNRNGLDRTL